MGKRAGSLALPGAAWDATASTRQYLRRDNAVRGRMEFVGIAALHPPYVLQLLERRDFTSHTRVIATTPVPTTSQSEACLPVSV